MFIDHLVCMFACVRVCGGYSYISDQAQFNFFYTLFNVYDLWKLVKETGDPVSPNISSPLGVTWRPL